jgi:predicted O-linked N-acetylglucosamine transferase (SPINDLY family)
LPRHRIKIGYVSSSMGPSRLGELTIGWVEHHDHQQFEIFGYYTQSSCDALTTQFRQACDRFRHLPDRDLKIIAQTIADDHLDVLIFTDLGIDPLLGVLAAMRLATVQCTSWSHPITTGLETIDYFLSSAAMEIETSDPHYSETLVRLADIGIVFPRTVVPDAAPLRSSPRMSPSEAMAMEPLETPPADRVLSEPSQLRQQFGLAIEKTLFLCCQSLFKYLPQDDSIWAAIAAGVPDSQLVFIAHPSPQITQQFRQRLERSFAEQGLDFDGSAIILPRLSEADYLRVNQCCDIFLDSFHWSGGVTTLKAIACGLPVVTCPGALMRSRHSFGILQTLGVIETIATTPVEYINIAIRLAHDPAWRHQIRDQIMARQDRLYNNIACVQDLETFAIEQILPDKQQPLAT